MRSPLIFFGILNLVLVFGCGEDPVTKPEPKKPNVFWAPIGLSGEVFMQLLYHEGNLYVAAARDGAFVQNPAFFGKWVKLERGFPEFYQGGTLPGPGPYAITFHENVLHAGVWEPSSYNLPGIYHWSDVDSTWVPSPNPLSDAEVYSLASSGNRNLVASTGQRGVQVSEDNGVSWRLTSGSEGSLNPWLLFFNEPRGLYAAGSTALFYPVLKKSTDHGLTWEELTWKLPGGDGRISSLAESPNAPYPLYIFFQTNAYVAVRDTSSFVPILETSGSGTILLNPLDPMEVWVGSDSLYRSPDGGISWRGYNLPQGGSRLGEATVDWERRLMAIVVWDAGGQGTIHCVNLDAAPDSIP